MSQGRLKNANILRYLKFSKLLRKQYLICLKPYSVIDMIQDEKWKRESQNFLSPINTIFPTLGYSRIS